MPWPGNVTYITEVGNEFQCGTFLLLTFGICSSSPITVVFFLLKTHTTTDVDTLLGMEYG